MRLGKRTSVTIGAAIVVAILGASAATQMLATRFAHQPALGARLELIDRQPIYPPFAILTWSKRWSQTYPRAFAIPKLVFMLAMMSAGFLLLLGLRPLRQDQRPFGAQAWGGADDAREAGLFAEGGVILGKLGRDILAYDGPHHLLLTGGTRSGQDPRRGGANLAGEPSFRARARLEGRTALEVEAV